MAITVRLGLALCLLVVAVSAQGQPKLIFEENFDVLDEGRWHHLVTAWRGGNDEFQYYRNNRKNSWVENGILKVRPTPVNEELSDSDIRYGYIRDPGCNLEPCTSQSNGDETTQVVYSARLHTQGSFSTRFGRIEVRAKLPRGDFIWPAIWMLPESSVYGDWPRSGEIDIMESRGNRNLHAGSQSVGVDLVASTLHWGPDAANNRFYLTHWEKNGPDYSDDFHVYEAEWTQDHLAFKVDGQEIGRVTPPGGGFWQLGGFDGPSQWGSNPMAPFDQPFHCLINVAVGGRFFDDSFTPFHPWNWNSGHPMREFYENQNAWHSTWDRPALEVDYIRIYEV